MAQNVLLVGEAWQSIQFDIKGFDFFSRSTYHESIEPLQDALESNGVETEYIPTTRAAREFPTSAEELVEFDEFEQVPNRLQLLEDFVLAGGGLIMVGGYLSFQGFNGKARYKDTAVERALPVTMQSYDDRVERSDGVEPVRTDDSHPVIAELPEQWPALLGYNRVVPDGGADELVRVDEDPLVVVGEHGDGRSAAFTSDCAPHWGSPQFTDWEHYDPFWTDLVDWVADD